MLLLVCCYCVHVSASDALQPTVLRKHIKETVNAFLRFMFFCHHEICSTVNRSYSNNAVALVSLEYNGCCWIIMLTPAAYWCSNNNYCSFLASYTNIFAFIWHILVFLDLCKVKFQQHQYVFFFFEVNSNFSPNPYYFWTKSYNRVWNYPEALTVCVLGLSRHLRALVHSEWLHAGPVPSLRITWIRIRFAEDIRDTEEISHNKCFCSVGAFCSRVNVQAKQSNGKQKRD